MGFELVHEFAVIGTTCFVVALHLLIEQLGWFSAGHSTEFTYAGMSYLLLSYGALFFILAVMMTYLVTLVSAPAALMTLSGLTLTSVLAATNQAPSKRRIWLAVRAAALVLIGSTVLFYWPW